MGGDWFDVIPLSGARVALVVGDVVGHGIQASATMGRLRTAVRTLADVDLPPDELLTHLDDLVIHLAAESRDRQPAAVGDIGATCLYAVYDPVSRRCTLARAGHPLPAVVTPDGTVGLPRPARRARRSASAACPSRPPRSNCPRAACSPCTPTVWSRTADRDIDEGLDALREVLARAGSVPGGHLRHRARRRLLPDRPADDVALLARPHPRPGRRPGRHLGPAGRPRRRRRGPQERAVGSWPPGAWTRPPSSPSWSSANWSPTPSGYGGAPIQLRLIRDRTLICEVSDASSTAPHLRRARTFDEGGRGLLLVAQLTQRWGTRQTHRRQDDLGRTGPPHGLKAPCNLLLNSVRKIARPRGLL